MLTAERLRELLLYDPTNGVFRQHSGHAVGARDHGYIRIKLDGKKYYAHRIAWLYRYGYWPSGVVDHVDGNGENNAIANLRSCGQSQNQANRRLTNNSRLGLKGVTRNHARFMAQITVNRAVRYLGTFDSPQDAHAAYMRAAKGAFGEFAYDGLSAR